MAGEVVDLNELVANARPPDPDATNRTAPFACAECGGVQTHRAWCRVPRRATQRRFPTGGGRCRKYRGLP